MIDKKIKTFLILGLFALISNLALGASDIKKVKRLVARLQMEILELKEKSSNSASEQASILEPQNEKIEVLTKENLELSKTLKDLELKFLLLEEKLEKYKQESSSEQLLELNQLATILTLISVGEISSIEPLVLELINQGNNIKQDLLIFLLADTQKNQGFIEQSLNYYILLVSDYPESRYRNRAIFEASELLGKLGHIEEQNSMLEALKEIDGPYGILARKRLGINEPFNSKEQEDKEQNQEQEDKEQNQEQEDKEQNQEQEDKEQNQEQAETEQNQEQEDKEQNQEQAEIEQNQEQEDKEQNQEQAETEQNQEQAETEQNQEQKETEQNQEQEDKEEDEDSDY